MQLRSANKTILGYFYQFDKTILEIFKQSDYSNIITVEGIEDIDIESKNEIEIIQCKYHESLEYNHSQIKKAIIYLLEDFIKNNQTGYKYTLYAYFKYGKEKLKMPIDIEYLKKNFLEYKEKGKQHKVYEELGVTDEEIQKFLKVLNIELVDLNYQNQKDDVINLLVREFNCQKNDAENFYYVNAINEISNLAIQSKLNERKISKRDFVNKINKKEIIFNRWINEYLGRKQTIQKIREDYFCYTNISPNERIFLIESKNENKFEMVELINCIIKKWTKISARESNSFCPYIFIYNYTLEQLVELKKELRNNKITFWDGFNYEGAEFSVQEICKQANHNNGIQIKFINRIEFVENIIQETKKTKEIYQFYYNEPFFINENSNIKHIKVQILNINEIKEII